MRLQRVGVLFSLAVLSLAGQCLAHGPVARVSEATEFEARLFTADAQSGEIVAIDLPSGEIVARVATPPYVMQLGISRDPRYLFAMRGRNTDRDFVTVIDTGIDPAKAKAQPPVVVRTISADTPGGIRGGRMASVGGRDAIFMEGSARVVVMNNPGYESLGSPQPSIYQLANPDHYHYLESEGFLYVGHLRSGMVQILDRATGEEVGRIENCLAAHGMHLDQATGRLLYGCRDNTVVIGSRGDETNRELARIDYPAEQRAAAFQEARDRVLWAYTEGTLPALYRLDLKKEPWAFEVLPVSRSIQQKVSADGRFLLVLTRAGQLQIHDGASGDLLREVVVSSPLKDDLHEHVDKAILPAIETLGDKAYISLPHEGRIVEVAVDSGRVTRAVQTGGEPTRLVAVARPSMQLSASVDTSTADGRWFEAADIESGAEIYRLNCAVCHGSQAGGNFGGAYPENAAASVPPPLDGSAGSAALPLDKMLEAINDGSDPAMPAFGSLLSEAQKLAVIAWYQSLWSPEDYDRWTRISSLPIREVTTSTTGSAEQPHTHADGRTHSH